MSCTDMIGAEVVFWFWSKQTCRVICATARKQRSKMDCVVLKRCKSARTRTYHCTLRLAMMARVGRLCLWSKPNTCICSPNHLRISRMIKQLFSKSSSFFQSRRLAISPLKFKESSWRSLSHTKRSLTQGIWLPELLSHIEHQAGNKFNTHDYIFLPASPSSTTPFRVGGSATVDMGTGRTTLMIT